MAIHYVLTLCVLSGEETAPRKFYAVAKSSGELPNQQISGISSTEVKQPLIHNQQNVSKSKK